MQAFNHHTLPLLIMAGTHPTIPPIRPSEHAYIRSSSAHLSSYYSRHRRVGSECTAHPTEPHLPPRDPRRLALCPAVSERTENHPEKPSFKFSCSRPQTVLLLGNHKPTPFKDHYVTCLGKGERRQYQYLGGMASCMEVQDLAG